MVRYACFIFARDERGDIHHRYVVRDDARRYRVETTVVLHESLLEDRVINQREWYDIVELRKLWARVRVESPGTYDEARAAGYFEPEEPTGPRRVESTPSERWESKRSRDRR
ncbi:hypothetical protein AKJ09_09873 [Labilithrix luteola]|uniref:Uncharacterized protein n=1 Tax=Labilithrix luteola TaxID=1391654 RepID=A0A0K1QCS4_9BACT|nr:hypothetical protein [Labilithrix luteola]AKV03210.1 hypothetical protein AKJ09_09873 [Labilithrix luteola]